MNLRFERMVGTGCYVANFFSDLFSHRFVSIYVAVKAVEMKGHLGVLAEVSHLFGAGIVGFVAAKYHPMEVVDFSAEVELMMSRMDKNQPIPRWYVPKRLELF